MDGRTVRRWINRSLGVLFVIAVVAMLVYAWIPKPLSVDVAEAERITMRVTVDEVGRTRVMDRYVVSAPLMGNLARPQLDPGDRVQGGEVVARIEPLAAPLLDPQARAQAEARVASTRAAQRQAQATVGRVQAAVDQARDEAQRQRRLARAGAVPEQAAERAEMELRQLREELESARFAAQVAAHEVEMAEAALGRIDERGPRKPAEDDTGEELMEIRSPVGGVVLRVPQESAGVVQPGAPLLEIGDPTSLEIVTDVLTSDAVEIEPGAPVAIERWGGDETLQGRVRLVEPSAFTELSALGVEEQRVNVIIDLVSPREAWEELGDGYRVETRIVVWREDDVLAIPASAVFRHEGGWAVYQVVDGTAQLTPIEIGRRDGLRVQVLSGLEAGDEVILHPSDRVADGVEVRAR